MVATIRNLDTANLFMGDDDPSNSQFLVMRSIQLPNFEEVTRGYNPTGGIIGITMGMRRLNTFTLAFSLTGIQDDALDHLMTGQRENYTVRGNIHDLSTQEDIPLVCVVSGRLTKVTRSNFQKDDGVDTDYEINEIVKYREVHGTTEKFFVDAFMGPAGLRINGKQPHRQVARNIGIV